MRNSIGMRIISSTPGGIWWRIFFVLADFYKRENPHTADASSCLCNSHESIHVLKRELETEQHRPSSRGASWFHGGTLLGDAGLERIG